MCIRDRYRGLLFFRLIPQKVGAGGKHVRGQNFEEVQKSEVQYQIKGNFKQNMNMVYSSGYLKNIFSAFVYTYT